MGQGNQPKAKKSLGQNFLQDMNIANKIVDALDIKEDDSVLEIGPGPGALTTLIASKAYKKLVLIDKDDNFAAQHAQALAKSTPFPSLLSAIDYAESHKVAVTAADALRAPWEQLQGIGWKFIGNLPYNIASPLMWDIVSKAKVNRAVFMIQKEVAERVTAKPNTSAYGALSAWIQSFVDTKLLFIVPPQVFFPRPKVHSAVVLFTPLQEKCCNFNQDSLASIIKLVFQYRRKQLGTILKKYEGYETILDNLSIYKEQRPETLTPHQFHQLSNTLFHKGVDIN